MPLPHIGGGGGFVEEFAVGVEGPDSAGGLVEDEAAIVGGIFEIGFGLAAEDEDAGVAIEGIARGALHIGSVVGVLGEFSVVGGALGERFPAVGFEVGKLIAVLELVELDL